VAGIDLVTGLEFKLGNGRLERIRRKVQLRAAGSADQVVVVVSDQLVGKMATANLGRIYHAVLSQKLQCSINGCLGHAGGTRALVNLSGRKMSAFVQGLQNGQTLGGHTIAARPQGLGMFGNAGQGELLGLNPEKLWKNRILGVSGFAGHTQNANSS